MFDGRKASLEHDFMDVVRNTIGERLQSSAPSRGNESAWPWIVGLSAAALVIAGAEYAVRRLSGRSLADHVSGRFGPPPPYDPNDLSAYRNVLPPTESGVAAV